MERNYNKNENVAWTVCTRMYALSFLLGRKLISNVKFYSIDIIKIMIKNC